MKLGDKVFFFDMDDCVAIRKGTITCIKQVHGYLDYLSSRPDQEYEGTEITVCAVKNGDHRYFEPAAVFTTMDEVKEALAEEALRKFDILE